MDEYVYRVPLGDNMIHRRSFEESGSRFGMQNTYAIPRDLPELLVCILICVESYGVSFAVPRPHVEWLTIKCCARVLVKVREGPLYIMQPP